MVSGWLAIGAVKGNFTEDVTPSWVLEDDCDWAFQAEDQREQCQAGVRERQQYQMARRHVQVEGKEVRLKGDKPLESDC